MSDTNAMKHSIELDFAEASAKDAARRLAFALLDEYVVSPSRPRHTMTRIRLSEVENRAVVVQVLSPVNAPQPPEGWKNCRRIPNGAFLGWERTFAAGNETLVVWQRCAAHIGNDMVRER